LDEDTSSLDSKNEADIQKTISELIAGHTVIVIFHRLKIIKDGDNIVIRYTWKINE